MKATLSLLFSIIFLSFTLAQDLVLSPMPSVNCQPGVINKSPSKGISFEYGLIPNLQLRNQNTFDISNPTKIGVSKQFKFKLKAPILLKDNLKLLAGWNYAGEEYSFDYLGTENGGLFNSVDDIHLKSSSLSLYLIKSINHKYYFAAKAQASFNGDYDGMFNFDQRYASYNLATIFGVKKRANVEWGVGLLFRHGPNTNLPVLPFGIYNHTFNDKWGIEATIPSSIKGRYNINKKNILLFGPEFESRSYAVDNLGKESEPYFLRRSELRFAVNYQRHLGSWFWLELSTGYTHNFTTSLEIDNMSGLNAPANFNTSSSPFFKVGVFISPSSMKKKGR